MADAYISDKSREILLKTQDASGVDENVSPLWQWTPDRTLTLLCTSVHTETRPRERKQAGTTRAKN